MGQYVGIDLHRRSTTIVRMAEDGEVLGTERFVSQPFELAQAMAAAGPEPEVVLTLVFYALRDGEVRASRPPSESRPRADACSTNAVAHRPRCGRCF